MEAATIITIIMVSGLLIERVLKHFKKSKCCGGEVEFNENASVPDFSKFPLNKK